MYKKKVEAQRIKPIPEWFRLHSEQNMMEKMIIFAYIDVA